MMRLFKLRLSIWWSCRKRRIARTAIRHSWNMRRG